MTQGRETKGCVVVFASGNWGVIDYPASFHQNILCVGAIDKNGTRSIFNERQSSGCGNLLDVVAPGSDILSTLPYNSTGYNGGTSMAAPHVAGIAALILSVRPDLTQAQVRHAIESSCTKLSGYSYSNNSNHPNGTWNNEVGHGLVNAFEAINQFFPKISGPNAISTTTCQSSYSITVNLPLSSITNAQWSCGQGLVKTADNGINGATFQRSENMDDPQYANIYFSFSYNGVQHTVSKRILARSKPTFHIVDANNHQPQLYSGIVTNKSYYFQAFPENPNGISMFQWVLVRPNAFDPNLSTTTQTSMISPINPVGELYQGISTQTSPTSFTKTGVHTLYLRTKDGCSGNSWASLAQQTFAVLQGNLSYSYRVYPNPTNEVLTIEFEPQQTAFSTLSSVSQTPQSSSMQTCDIKLFDKDGYVIKQLLWQSNQMSNKVQMDTRNLKKGTYYLHLESNGMLKKEQIIVN